MKMKSNQIIIVIVAFLVGILVASAFMRDKDTVEPVTEEVTEAQAEDATQPAEEKTEAPETTQQSTSANAQTASATTPKPTTTQAPAQSSNTASGGSCHTGLSARKDIKLNAIVLNWSACSSDEFQFYKLVKSSTNSNPSYPGDGVAFSSSNKNAANFVDKTVAPRTTYYYRMCIVQRLGVTNCSNVASVSF